MRKSEAGIFESDKFANPRKDKIYLRKYNKSLLKFNKCNVYKIKIYRSIELINIQYLFRFEIVGFSLREDY